MFAKTNLCSKNETQLGLLSAPEIGREGGVYELSITWQGGDGSNCFGCPKYSK